MIEAIAAALQQSAEVHRRLSAGGQDAIARAAEAIRKALEGGNKLLIFGNGGSAADAQHIASEFVGRFSRERGGLPALALTTDSSALTSIGNDLGFDAIFARQLEALGAPGDVALGISTSGKSANVLSAIQVARRMGLVSIGFTGGDGGELVPSADISIVAPTDVVPRIQECHITIGHVLCDVVEAALLHAPTERAARGPKLINLDDLLALREQWRREGQTVVWTNGCFDILHAGHVRSLAAAKALGDVLIVGINDDRSVRELKGPDRPLVPVEDRADLLAALEPVDYVVVFDGPTPEPALARLRPDVHCKGGDYAPPNGRPVPEAELVVAYGGRVEFLPFLPGHSTSDLIDRIRAGREHRPGA